MMPKSNGQTGPYKIILSGAIQKTIFDLQDEAV